MSNCGLLRRASLRVLSVFPATFRGQALALIAVGSRIVDASSFRRDMAWESILFIGAVLGLAPTFELLGISEWIVDAFQPAIVSLTDNPLALTLGVAAMTVLARFVIVSEVAYMNIFMAFMVPLCTGLGINPWVVAIAVYAMVNPWFFPYQNPVYMAAQFATHGNLAIHGMAQRYCLVYLATCAIGLAISVPYWLASGTFYL